MTATIKKLHQGLDNVDFIGTENIIRVRARPVDPLGFIGLRRVMEAFA